MCGIVFIVDTCVIKSLEEGLCVNALRCPSAQAEIKLNKHPQLCRFEGKEPIICCAKEDVISDVGDISRKSKFFFVVFVILLLNHLFGIHIRVYQINIYILLASFCCQNNSK